MKDDVLKADPVIAAELMRLFAASKSAYGAELAAETARSPADEAAREISRVVGDPFPFGVAANRKAIETIVDFAWDQRVIPRRLGVEELFAVDTIGEA